MTCDGRPKLNLPALAIVALGLLLPGCGDSKNTAKVMDAPGLERAKKELTSSKATARSGSLMVTLTATPSHAKAGLPVELSATAYERNTPYALSYQLRYGDGMSAAREVVPLICVEGRRIPARRTWRLFHRYKAAGRYRVSASVYINCTSEHATVTVAVDVT